MEEALFNRRQVVTGGIIAAFAALWKPGDALATETPPVEGATAVYDVALLGNTFAANMPEALNLEGQDLRGVGFYVEGHLYPAGTIPAGDGWDPAAAAPTGHWFCHGWLMNYPGRPLPHVVSTQEYVFSRISEQQLSPPDQLVSTGLEGGVPQIARPVIGGTGRYRGARGEVIEQTIGTNKTTYNVFGIPGVNLRFHFII